MAKFLVKSSNIYKLPNNPHMLCLGIIGKGLQEYIILHCIAGPHKGKTYIEELVVTTLDYSLDITANCRWIADDNLAQDLAAFAQEKGLLDIAKRLEQAQYINQFNFNKHLF